tara:strand:- start:679 stop:1938 length:1260 start_codon:yes stop_codon:yes gene_type:complete
MENNPFENLRSTSKFKLQKGSASSIEELYDSLIKPQFKHEDTIRIIHNSILSYVDGLTPTFFLRLYGSFKRDSYHNQRRGFLSQYPNGMKISYCDNTFTLIFAGMKLSGIPFSSDDLKNLFQNRKLVVGFAQVSAEKELAYYSPIGAIRYNINSLGWYQAHIKPVGKHFSGFKSLKKVFPNPERDEFNNKSRIRMVRENLNEDEINLLKAHFIRLIHPFNSFLVPKPKHLQYNGSNIGEEPNLILYVRDRIMDIFPKEFKEFDIKSMKYSFENSDKLITNIKWHELPLNQNINQSRIKSRPSLRVYYGSRNSSIKRKINGMKIGQFVQESFRNAYKKGLIKEEEIDRLQDPEYSKRIFNANYEVLRFKTKSVKDQNQVVRYYKKELFCDDFHLSSQWYETQWEFLLKWLNTIGYKIKTE